MSKRFLLSIFILFTNPAIIAQKGRNQLNLVVGANVPLYQNDRGFRSKRSIEQTTTSTPLIPVLAGYKQNIHKFYIELQGGYGELAGKINIGGDYARPSGATFFGLLEQAMITKELVSVFGFSKLRERNQLLQACGMIKIFNTQRSVLAINYFDAGN